MYNNSENTPLLPASRRGRRSEDHLRSEKERVYKSIKHRILYDDLKAGEHLAEITLAEEYNVSRLTIKSVLTELSGEQLIEHKHNRGYFVIGFTPESENELNLLRKHLTALIVSSIIHTITDEQIEELYKIYRHLKLFVENEMFDDAIDKLREYYAALESFSPYKRIVSILDTYNDYNFAIVRKSVTESADHQYGVRYIKKLTDAIASHDMHAAIQAVSLQTDFHEDPDTLNSFEPELVEEYLFPASLKENQCSK